MLLRLKTSLEGKLWVPSTSLQSPDRALHEQARYSARLKFLGLIQLELGNKRFKPNHSTNLRLKGCESQSGADLSKLSTIVKHQFYSLEYFVKNPQPKDSSKVFYFKYFM